MAFTYDFINDPLAPVPAGGYGPDGLNGPLPGQGISQPGEVDVFYIELAGLVDYTASVFGNTLSNPYLEIYDPNGNLVDFQDDSWIFGPDPFIQFKASTTSLSGVYTFLITDLYGGVGDYTFVVSPAGVPISF